MYRDNTTSTLKNLVIGCMAMNLSEKEALEYLKDKGHNISHDTFYRHKRKIIESRFDRLGLIAKSQFVDQHLDRIANLELINKEMWSLYRKENNNFKKVLILEKIAELQTYISPYYDASRYVMEQSIKSNNQNETEKSHTLSVL